MLSVCGLSDRLRALYGGLRLGDLPRTGERDGALRGGDRVRERDCERLRAAGATHGVDADASRRELALDKREVTKTHLPIASRAGVNPKRACFLPAGARRTTWRSRSGGHDRCTRRHPRKLSERSKRRTGPDTHAQDHSRTNGASDKLHQHIRIAGFRAEAVCLKIAK